MPRTLTAARRYHSHKNRARIYGIPWEFTFQSWLAVWEKSGKWPERGRGSKQYVMARHGDTGPYGPQNVKIITNEENIRESWALKPRRLDGVDWKTARAKGYAARGPTGRGWTYRHDDKKHYEVKCRGRYVGMFETQDEAEAAYRAARASSLADAA